MCACVVACACACVCMAFGVQATTFPACAWEMFPDDKRYAFVRKRVRQPRDMFGNRQTHFAFNFDYWRLLAKTRSTFCAWDMFCIHGILVTICRMYLLHPYWFGVFVRACESHDVHMLNYVKVCACISLRLRVCVRVLCSQWRVRNCLTHAIAIRHLSMRSGPPRASMYAGLYLYLHPFASMCLSA